MNLTAWPTGQIRGVATIGVEMNPREGERREYRAPKLTVLGTVRDLTQMPNFTGKNKETHPTEKGSKLT